jgi:hypothetical protein
MMNGLISPLGGIDGLFCLSGSPAWQISSTVAILRGPARLSGQPEAKIRLPLLPFPPPPHSKPANARTPSLSPLRLLRLRRHGRRTDDREDASVIRVSTSDFGFGCTETPPDLDPTRCHPYA